MDTDQNSEFDFDSRLLQQFSSMATQDRDVLIADFKSLLGSHLNDDGCAFYLDMNNWNLQDAVCSYLELQKDSTTYRRPQMSFESDIDDSPEGDLMPLNTTFCRRLRLANDGDEAWPSGCYLLCDYGESMAVNERVAVEPLQPGATTELTIEMKSPANNGFYRIQWRMRTNSGLIFGDSVLVQIRVSDDVEDLSEYMRRLASRSTTNLTTPQDGMTLNPGLTSQGSMDADELGSHGDAGLYHAQSFQSESAIGVLPANASKDPTADQDTMEMS